MELITDKMNMTVLLTMIWIASALGNLEGESLYAFKAAVEDPGNILDSWDPALVDPCTWLFVTCNENNLVIRVDLANARLSGRLVPEIANLKALKYLELFHNNLSGSIPEEFGRMKQLVSLNLEENAISGRIPRALGGMSSLVFLRLGKNRLSGRIPSELTNIDTLQVLNLSYNILSGEIPRGGCFNRFMARSFQENPGLCGEVIKKTCVREIIGEEEEMALKDVEMVDVMDEAMEMSQDLEIGATATMGKKKATSKLKLNKKVGPSFICKGPNPKLPSLTTQFLRQYHSDGQHMVMRCC